jgi:DNA polymerase III sliding clamp (beta) subunit (PCNA family)
MEMAISANKFLDLLESVIPVSSSDTTRPNICTIRLEVIAADYKIRAVATNGYIISIGERFLGFSDEQEDLEDLKSKSELQDSEYLISKIDAEILALSLKKLGVRRGSEDKTKGRYYIIIRENENKLTISILGLSHVVMEPTLIKEEFPDYRNMIPRSNDNSNSSYLNLRLSTLSYLAKCWGNERVNMEFFGQTIKVSRDLANQEKYEELGKDCLILRF